MSPERIFCDNERHLLDQRHAAPRSGKITITSAIEQRERAARLRSPAHPLEQPPVDRRKQDCQATAHITAPKKGNSTQPKATVTAASSSEEGAALKRRVSSYADRL